MAGDAKSRGRGVCVWEWVGYPGPVCRRLTAESKNGYLFIENTEKFNDKYPKGKKKRVVFILRQANTNLSKHF